MEDIFLFLKTNTHQKITKILKLVQVEASKMEVTY